jgi:hypothetical protein
LRGTLLALLFVFDLASLVSRLQMCPSVATHVGMHIAVQFVFALVRLVSWMRMRACVATHVALYTERAVASLKGAFERCGVAALATEGDDGRCRTNELILTTLACVAVDVDLERAKGSLQFLFL